MCTLASLKSAAAAVSAWFAFAPASRKVKRFLGWGKTSSNAYRPIVTAPSICSISGGS